MFNKFFGNVNFRQLEQSLNIFKNSLNTREGMELKEKLSKLDKGEILRRLGQLDKTKLPTNEDLIEMANNPELIKKLNKFLDER